MRLSPCLWLIHKEKLPHIAPPGMNLIFLLDSQDLFFGAKGSGFDPCRGPHHGILPSRGLYGLELLCTLEAQDKHL